MKQKIPLVICLLLLAGAVISGGRLPAPDIPSLPETPLQATPVSATAPPSSSLTTDASVSRPQSLDPPGITLQPAHISTLPQTGEQVVSTNGHPYPLRTYRPLLAANDPLAAQWWVQDTELAAAWDYGSGSYTPTIAVIDTGFALMHEEFANRWHQNTGEQGTAASEATSALNCSDRGLPLSKSCNRIDDNFDTVVDNETGATTRENPSRRNCSDQGLPLDKSCNLIDDDGNTYIDDVIGWDFVNHDPSVQAGQTNPGGSGTIHGTLVAGILGATGNNQKGIAGVNWSAKLLPLQALDDDSYGNTLTVARAIAYASDQRADIISVSLGADAEDPYLRQAIEYAIARGSLVVAASGNGGCDCMTYPARYPEVIAVGSYGQNGTPSAFSSYGAELDILAPGESITGPTWTSSVPSTAYASGAAGTSFATPYVSGLLGLAKSHQPTASWGELTATLFEQSDRRTLTPTQPHSATFGYGYTKADTLLARVTVPAAPGMRYTFGPVKPTDTLDSFRVHACENKIPTSFLYELTSGNAIRYTASQLTLRQSQQTGWSKSRAFPVCAGLPHDQPSTVRTINLLSELHNNVPNKW